MVALLVDMKVAMLVGLKAEQTDASMAARMAGPWGTQSVAKSALVVVGRLVE